MLPRAELTGTRPVAQIDAALPVAAVGEIRQQLYDRIAQIAIGKTMMADVLSRLNDGTFIVKIADTAVRVAIPADVSVGDQIPLKLVATNPKPTFLLTPAAQTPSEKGVSTASLSSAGRLIGTVLQTAQQEGTPTAIVGKTPVVASPHVPPAQVASALHDAIALSGVFYESHVQQWATGERPLATLMREPQAQAALNRPGLPGPMTQGPLGATPPPPGASPGVTANMPLAEIAKLIDIVTAWDSTGRPAAIDIGTTGATIDDKAGEAAKSSADAAPALPKLDSESSQRINLQLNTLENNRIAWQGELWPGQKLEWEINEDTPHSSSDHPEQSSWTSVVRFELPMLGVITASIHLDGDHVRMQVKTTTDQAAAVLRSHGDDLASALDAAGSPLDLLTVKKDEEA